MFLNEAYSRVKKMTGVAPLSMPNFRRILRDDRAWKIYTNALCEGLNPKLARQFKTLTENTRFNLLENSITQLNPYETLTVPILRRFYPRLVAKELVNVSPIDKPEVIKGFLRAYFGTKAELDSTSQSGAAKYPYQFPYIDRTNGLPDISRGFGSDVVLVFDATDKNVNLLEEFNLTSSVAHISKDTKIIGYKDGTVNVSINPVELDIDGHFEIKKDSTSPTILGKVNLETGDLVWSSDSTNVASIKIDIKVSLEENLINPKVRFTIEKLRFQVVLRQISAEWSIPFEQDTKALYDINAQEELVNFMGEQIAADIDREIIDNLISSNTIYNPASHVDTFDYNPPTSFTWGPKMWFENILPVLSKLSAQVYNDTFMDSANTIACNPLDAAIFESLNDFGYTGSSAEGGEVGYRTATIQGGKWKILVSSIVPVGKMIVKYKSDEEARAAYVYAPYVPVLLTPYPLGPNPSVTVMSRYASRIVRPEAIAVLNINRS